MELRQLESSTAVGLRVVEGCHCAAQQLSLVPFAEGLKATFVTSSSWFNEMWVLPFLGFVLLVLSLVKGSPGNHMKEERVGT